jgi:predicted metal-dependent HD superfamily phosphohydrolase
MPLTEIDISLQADPSMRDALPKERFTDLWRRCLVPEAQSDIDAIWETIRAGYGEPNRRYHGNSHLLHSLAQFDLAIGCMEHPDAVETAIWFHDVIVEPGRKDNEQRSVDLFREVATDALESDFVDRVADLILVTTHFAPLHTEDQRLMCDIDLSSFGRSWEGFLEDSAAVKAEFRGTEEDYRRGKRAFLQGLLQRPRIFQTDFFRDRYEEQARDNIARFIRLLEEQQSV